MDSSTSDAPPNMFPQSPHPLDTPPLGNPGEYHCCYWFLLSFILIGIDGQTSNAACGKDPPNNRVASPLSMDLAEEIKGMYRLLDLISESGSNGCGK